MNKEEEKHQNEFAFSISDSDRMSIPTRSRSRSSGIASIFVNMFSCTLTFDNHCCHSSFHLLNNIFHSVNGIILPVQCGIARATEDEFEF
jgi:hypothetical protein